MGLDVDTEEELQIDHGNTVLIKHLVVGCVSKKDGMHNVIVDLNGRQRMAKSKNDAAGMTPTAKPKVSLAIADSVGDNSWRRAPLHCSCALRWARLSRPATRCLY